ncbi:c-type cytochrome [Mitsuaria sp. GD03876]|uniref:c-type cytochrome n=1 Tax=Mitsuaria sp. GD03876 TaxID=2975399 RepID=UPI00244CDFB1|nr:c-type cytochrome [Mitsuaria sp. GD03876]MDH0864150.1 cytochrome c [Mitsuaria sp. GD03876]
MSGPNVPERDSSRGTSTGASDAGSSAASAPMRTFVRGLIGLAIAVPLMALLLVAGAWSREAWLVARPVQPGVGGTDPALLARGAYLARIANCAGCHSPRGAAPMAGGLPLGTPFGTLFSSNLTPDAETGLGRWTADDFWRAMHHGRSRDGRLLYPAFPYTSYTAMSREDADAIFAWLRQLPPVRQTTPAHQLGWPYRWQTALAVWRLMYFTPGDAPSHDEAREPGTSVRGAEGSGDTARAIGANGSSGSSGASGASGAEALAARGRYLVQAVGHCAECHAPRNRLGALEDATGLRGGWVGVQGWIAPSLADPKAAGVQDWTEAEVSQWLRAGWSPRGAALGPMADVVAESLQHLSEDDARAMAAYLHGLPREGSPAEAFKPAPPAQMDLGRQVYAKHCADCHGDQGQGRRIDGQPAYPPLAGNRAVTLDAPQNVLQMLAGGGYAPTTAAHPRPFGMPPLKQVLTEAEMAAVATVIRQSWGNQAPAVTEQDVLRLK